jgi:hypothetical protein
MCYVLWPLVHMLDSFVEKLTGILNLWIKRLAFHFPFGDRSAFKSQVRSARWIVGVLRFFGERSWQGLEGVEGGRKASSLNHINHRWGQRMDLCNE